MLLNKRIEKFCPKCGADITDSYEEEEMGWWCEECQMPVDDDERQD